MQPSAAQSHLRFPLTRVLGNGGNVRVLRALLAYGAPLSASQLAADTGLTPRGVRMVLDSLAAQGLVSVLGQARAQLYEAAPSHPLMPALKALFEAEQTHWQAFQEGLRAGLDQLKVVRSAWLYGSVARAQDEPRSDVDLAVVVASEDAQATLDVRDALQGLGDRLGVSLSVVALTPADIANRVEDDPWWTELSRDAKVLKGLSPKQEATRSARAQLA